MKLHKFLMLIFVLLGCLGSLKAQIKPEASKSEEDELRGIATNFVEAYAKFTQNKDKQTVLTFFSDKVSAMLVNTNIQGTVQPFESNYAGLVEYFDRLVAAEDLHLEYKLAKIARVNIVNDIGAVFYDAEYKIEKDSMYWSKGFETVYLVFKKEKDSNNQWKIVHYTSLTIEDEKLRGDCYCEFFVSQNQNFITRTVIPSGKNYETKLNNFSIKTKDGQHQVSVEGKIFDWKDKKQLYGTGSLSTTDSTPQEQLIGEAKTPEEVISLVLKEVLYPQNCAEIKIRRRGTNNQEAQPKK